MNRIIFENEFEKEEAEIVLEEAGEDFDYDGGDRMIIDYSGMDTLDNAGIDYTIV